MDPKPASETPEPAAVLPSEAGTSRSRDGLRRLLTLQELDTAIDRLSARLGQLESGDEVLAARAGVGVAESRVGQVRLETEELAREQRRLEGDIDSMDRKARAEEERKYDGTVSTVKELQAIEAEVANLKGRKTRAEDRVLELMERQEELDGALVALQAGLDEARSTLARIEETSGRELVDVERDLQAREEERTAVAADIDPVVRELYEHLRRQKKGIGAAALVSGVCQGCHQMLSPVYLDGLKRGTDLWRCEYCRRILVPA